MNPAIILYISFGFLFASWLGFAFNEGLKENPPWMAVVGSMFCVLNVAAIIGVIASIICMCRIISNATP